MGPKRGDFWQNSAWIGAYSNIPQRPAAGRLTHLDETYLYPLRCKALPKKQFDHIPLADDPVGEN